MPKRKTKKAVTKRFKITSSGKVMHGRQMGGHRKTHKSKTAINRHKKMVEISAGFKRMVVRHSTA